MGLVCHVEDYRDVWLPPSQNDRGRDTLDQPVYLISSADRRRRPVDGRSDRAMLGVFVVSATTGLVRSVSSPSKVIAHPIAR